MFNQKFLKKGQSQINKLDYQNPDDYYEAIFSQHKKFIKYFALIGLIMTFLLFAYIFKHNLFNRPEVFAEFISKYGNKAPLIYFLLSFFNTIYPLIPGGMGNVVGYSVFGSYQAFFLAFTANILGSMVIFLLARKFGKAILFAFFDRQSINKYIGYLDNKFFPIILAIVFILPGLPDDLFCMLAGLSSMKFQNFMLIQIFFKPLTTFAYMSGIHKVFAYFSELMRK